MNLQGFFQSISNLIPILLIIVVFYFFLIRPQEAKKRAHENFIKSAKNGERILTNSGLYGNIVKINENIIDIEIAKDVVIQISKDSILDIISRQNTK